MKYHASSPVFDNDLTSRAEAGVRASFWTMLLKVTGFFCIVFGVKLALAVRFGTNLPIADEWVYVDFLNAWHNGHHDRSALFHRHGQHLIVFTKLTAILIGEANGLLEPRLQTVVFGLVYAVYATLTMWILCRIFNRAHQMWILLAVLCVFAIPFGGYRSTWSFLDEFTYSMLFSMLAIYLVVFRPFKWVSDFMVGALILAAACSVGSGCLLGFAIAGFICLRGCIERKISVGEALLAVFGLTVFFTIYISMPSNVGSSGFQLAPAMVTLFSSLAWPSVFLPLAGALAFLPVLTLTIYFICGRLKGDRRAGWLVVFGSYIALQCAGIGLFRSDANNFGMPSNRYNDILILAPLANFSALLFLSEHFSRKRYFRVAALAWLCLTIGGFGIHLLWRTWPFLARENGEFFEATKQYAARRFLETGENKWVPDLGSRGGLEDVDIYDHPEVVRSSLLGVIPNSLLTPGSLVGIPVEPDLSKTSGFVADGYPFPYFAYAAQAYWGSYTDNLDAGTGTFLSKPFLVQTNYVIFDLVVQKRARFTNYRMEGLKLALIEIDNGQETSLLPQLKKTFPFIFRDRETVWAAVKKGRYYQIKATDESVSDWLAFSQPREGGDLTHLNQELLSSGKLLILFGVIGLMIGCCIPRVFVRGS